MARLRILPLLAGVATVAMVATACSSGSSSSTTTSPVQSPTSAASPTTGAATTAATSPGSAGAGGAEATVTITGDAAAVKAGLAYDIGGRGDQSFNDSAARGLDQAAADGVEIVGELEATAGEPDSQKVDRLHQLADAGATVIIAVGFAYATPLSEVAPEYPEIRFAIVDDDTLCDPAREGGPLDNVTCLTFAEEQGSYLAGVAAALKSQENHVGFIGGVNVPLIHKFEAGFTAGVEATSPDATVDVKYISEPPDFTGFNSPDKGVTTAKGMYDGGADIIYAAAGGSGAGVFQAAQDAGKWGIGVDSDQYNIPGLADVKESILTSMIKNVDVAVFETLAAEANGTPLTGQQIYDLASGGVSLSTSGGFIDDIEPQIQEAQAAIIDGSITVPTTVG